MRDPAEQPGAAERARATQAYRRSVRGTGVATVAAVAAVFLVNAALPGTSERDRLGLVVTAALVALTGTVWFMFVPTTWFAGARVLAASLLATGVLLVMVVLTGGAQSLYVGYLVVPAVVLILAGSAPQMLALAAAMFGGLALIIAASAAAGDPPGEAAAARLLLLATIIAVCTAVARATGRQRQITTERAAGLADESAAARSLAMTDPLTGLPNRRSLDGHLERFVSETVRTGLPFGVIALDLDGLKRVNDEHGHDAGDAMLRDFGRLIDDVIRGGDVGLRLGGDEFLILLPRTSELQARSVAERLAGRALLTTADRVPRFSYGVAAFEAGESGESVVARADAALNASKRERRSATRS